MAAGQDPYRERPRPAPPRPPTRGSSRVGRGHRRRRVERAGRQGRARPGHPHRARPGRRRRARPPPERDPDAPRPHRARPRRGPDRRAACRSATPRRRCGSSARTSAPCRREAAVAGAAGDARCAAVRSSPGRHGRPRRRPDRAVDLDVAADARMARRYRVARGHRPCARLDLPDKVAGRPRYIADLRPARPAVRPGRPAAVARGAAASTRRADGRRRATSAWSATAPSSGCVGADEAVVEPRGRAAAHGGHLGGAGPPARRGRPRRVPARRVRTTTSTCSTRTAPTTAGPRARTRAVQPALPGARLHRAELRGRPVVRGRRSARVEPQPGRPPAARRDRRRRWPRPRTAVVVEHAENAGCYGHNAADDAAFDAVLLARAVPGAAGAGAVEPPATSWPGGRSARRCRSTSRAPAAPSGRIVPWTYDVWSQGHTARPGYAGVPGLLAGSPPGRAAVTAPAASDPPLGGRWRHRPQRGPALRRRARARSPATGCRRPRCARSALRALGAFTNVFAIESFMDELRRAAGGTPSSFRLAHLTDPRARAVLELLPRPPGGARPARGCRGRGIGFARYKDRGAYCAVVAEVEAEREVRVRRLTVAVDVGLVVNPDGVRNQIEGGATQATSWTLQGAGPLRPAPDHQRRLGDLPDPALRRGARASTSTCSTVPTCPSLGRRRGRPGPDRRRHRQRRRTPRSACGCATCP